MFLITLYFYLDIADEWPLVRNCPRISYIVTGMGGNGGRGVGVGCMMPHALIQFNQCSEIHTFQRKAAILVKKGLFIFCGSGKGSDAFSEHLMESTTLALFIL